MINIKNSLIIVLISFHLYASQNMFDWNSMTSLINSTSITKDSNDNIISATSGGLLTLNGNQISIIKNNLNNLDLSIVGLDNKGLIWLGGSYPNGNIQYLCKRNPSLLIQIIRGFFRKHINQ